MSTDPTVWVHRRTGKVHMSKPCAGASVYSLPLSEVESSNFCSNCFSTDEGDGGTSERNPSAEGEYIPSSNSDERECDLSEFFGEADVTVSVKKKPGVCPVCRSEEHEMLLMALIVEEWDPGALTTGREMARCDQCGVVFDPEVGDE